jgi:CubicO group peptidase (beta-lactamase class C family)
MKSTIAIFFAASGFVATYFNKQFYRNSDYDKRPAQVYFGRGRLPVSDVPPSKFNAVLFETLVNEKMKNKSKGFAFAIGNKDGIMARCDGGWAQDPSDGNLRMTTKTPTCIGSVTKMLSVVALLNLLEAKPGVKLDDPVFSKLPLKWQQQYKNSRVEWLTYRQLLQHSSGFRKSGDVENLDSMASLGVGKFSAKRDYNNANISLLRYLIAGLAYPQDVDAIEKELKNLSFEDYSEQVNIKYSFPFEKYLVNTVLKKGIVPIKASCRPEPELMPDVAKGYDDRNDKTGVFTNTEKEHKEQGNHCAPQGSWYLSAEMLVQFGRTLLFTNNYLTSTTKNMMFDPAKKEESLGWWWYTKNTGFEKETGQAVWPMHNGMQSGTGYRAIIMQLPYGYVGAALVNSPVYLKSDNTDGLPNTTEVLADIMMQCFYEATHSGISVEIAKHAIPENKYQEEFSIIWNSGYYPVWVDAYNVNGKTFFNTIFRPNNSNYDVAVRHDMTGAGYQQEYDDYVKKKGFRLQQLESYNDAGKLKYAAIFIKNKKPERDKPQPAYHSLSLEEHQKLFEKYSGEGYVPVNVSVVTINGKRYYAAFYEKRNVGGHVLKSTLTQAEYQTMFDDMKNKGWEQVYINAYEYNNQTYFSAIWYEKSGYTNYTAIRKGSSDVYQQQWETNTGKGLLTRCVTGYEEGGRHWFAAHWSK